MLLYDDDEGEGMGLTQYLRADEDRLNDVQDILQNARRFLANFNFSNPKFRQLREECKNKHELCALWAAKGECKTNPLYMNLTCAPVCQACEYLLPEVRCPVDPNAVDAWHQPEDLNRMFERMTTHLDFQGYEPRILSSPTRTSDKAGAVLPQGDFPWVVIFDNFLSPQESGHLIGLIQEESYELSRVVLPEEQLNGIIPGRPNSYSVCHCLSTVCVQDETVQSILRRLEDVTRIPRDNYEHMHMLRYHVGQYTDTHTDFIFQHAREQQGARIFTVLMYLNHVEAGGGTYFPHLNVTVAPKPGRALIWPSVLNDEPNSMDNRTDHRGLPVVQGVKYGTLIFLFY
jgi:prolyl 4-hydroxylase